MQFASDELFVFPTRSDSNKSPSDSKEIESQWIEF